MDDTNDFVDMWGVGGLDFEKKEDESPITDDVDVIEQGIDNTPEAEEVDEELEGDYTRDDDSEDEDYDDEDFDDDEDYQDEDYIDEDDSEYSDTFDNEEVLENDTSGYGHLMQELGESGIALYDEDTEYETSPEGLRDLIEDTKEFAVREGIEEYKEGLDERGRQLLDIIEDGGSVEQFLAIDSQVDFSAVPLYNIDDEPMVGNQSKLVKDWMITQGYDQEDIEEKIDDLINADLLGKEAALSQKRLVKWQAAETEKMLEETRIEREEREEYEAEMVENFREEVLNTTEIAGFSITKQQSRKLHDYITKPVGPNGETKFVMDDNPESRMLYAFMSMTNFDKNKLSEQVRSREVTRLKRTLSNHTDGNARPKNSGRKVDRSGQVGISDIGWNM